MFTTLGAGTGFSHHHGNCATPALAIHKFLCHPKVQNDIGTLQTGDPHFECSSEDTLKTECRVTLRPQAESPGKEGSAVCPCFLGSCVLMPRAAQPMEEKVPLRKQSPCSLCNKCLALQPQQMSIKTTQLYLMFLITYRILCYKMGLRNKFSVDNMVLFRKYSCSGALSS